MSHLSTQLTLTIRGDEIDATGCASAAQLLRFAEHARWQATADAGPLGALFSGDERMVVRAQRMVLGVPVTWQDALRVETWIVRLGRTSVDLAHHIVRANDGHIVADILLTGVHVDLAGRPSPLPDALRAAPLRPVPGTSLDGLDFAPLGDPVWSMPLQIRPSLIDLFQHVNHANYLDLAQDVRWQWEQGGAPDSWRHNRGLRRAALEYVREIRAGQDVTGHLHASDAVTLRLELQRREADGSQTLCARMVLEVEP